MGADLESLSEATSAAIGALVSTTILYPFDTCKTKYQAEVRDHHKQKYRLVYISSTRAFANYFHLFFSGVDYNSPTSLELCLTSICGLCESDSNLYL